jgi:DNA-binding MarR family transcriptional regulator
MSDDAATRAWRALQALVTDDDRRRAVSEATGLSFGRMKALRRLADAPSTMRELAERIAADPPYVTTIVDDLEARGLVRRSPHPTDRRSKLVTLTAAGRRLAAKADKILDEPPAGWRDLPVADLEALERIARSTRP